MDMNDLVHIKTLWTKGFEGVIGKKDMGGIKHVTTYNIMYRISI